MAKKLIFGYLDHSKRHFCGFWMIEHEWYAGQSLQTIHFYWNTQFQANPMHKTQENDQNVIFCYLDHPKRHFCDFWMSVTIGQSCTPFISMIIRYFKSIRLSEIKKMAKKLIFGYLDHSKRYFRGFWMIKHECYHWPILHTV